MKEIEVCGTKNYKIIFSSMKDDFKSVLENYSIRNLYIITDENVYRLYKHEFDRFKDVKGLYIITPGEESKNKNVIFNIYDDMLKKECDRKTCIVAIGGGVVGDSAGFVASTFMRGIRFVNVPTSLMAQSDSSVGGKNGFDFGGYKNIIGTIYQPQFVFIDIKFINTLDYKEYQNGLAEVIKYGFIYDKDFFNYIDDNKEKIKVRDSDYILNIIYKSLEIKSSIVKIDEYDNELRHILNFGHTVGHGIESASNFSIRHGEAVSVGMLIEGYLSVRCGYLNINELKRFFNLITYFDMPVYFDEVDDKIIFKNMLKDKKNYNSKINYVLPDRIGHAIITDKIERNIIKDILKEWVEKKLWL